MSPLTTTESTDYPLRIGGDLTPGVISALGNLKPVKVTAILKNRLDGDLNSCEASVDSGLRHVTQKLLIALIENEINSASIFVAVARTAYSAAKFSDGNAALSKAEAIYAQASELARDSCGSAQQTIEDHLRELRQTIDAVMTGEAGA